MSERVWKQEYVTLIDGEDLSELFMALHLHDTVSETLDCLIQRVLVDLHVVHDYVNLRLLINLFPDLHNAISSKFDGILHVLIHLALVTN